MFDKIKEALEEEKEEYLKKLKEIDEKVWKVSKEIEELKREIKKKQENCSVFFDIIKLKSLHARLKRLYQKQEELNLEGERIREKLRLIEKDLKALKIIEEKRAKEELKKNLTVENLNLSYFHLIKKKIVGLLIVLSLSVPIFSLSASQERIKKDVEERVKDDIKLLVKLLEEKIKVLREERKRLEKLREARKEKRISQEKLIQLREQREKEIQRLVKAVSKADPDEIAPAIESLPPELAAEVLLRLKEKKAGQILANMNPQKAAQIMEIILERKPDFKISLEEEGF